MPIARSLDVVEHRQQLAHELPLAYFAACSTSRPSAAIVVEVGRQPLQVRGQLWRSAPAGTQLSRPARLPAGAPWWPGCWGC